MAVLGIIWGLAGAVAATWALPAAAQQSSSLASGEEPVSAPDARSGEMPPCLVTARDGDAAGRPPTIIASCQGRGLILGPATEFEVIGNSELQATLVDMQLGSERRVLLLSLQEDGVPLVEDLGGQIALAAGRGPMSAIDGVELDLAGFARSGAVGVRGRPEDTGPDKASAISLGQQIAAERARRRNAPASSE